VPFLWTGLEYFRSELYYLKFSWLNLGYAFTETSFALFHSLGVYGVGFCGAVFAGLFLVLRLRDILICSAIGLILCVVLAPLIHYRIFNGPDIAGVQLEFPNASMIRQALDGVLTEHAKRSVGKSGTGLSGNTNLDLIVLSEYTLDGEPTEQLKNWCRDNQKFLIVGGKDSSPGTNYYNTAFVISTNGEVVFKQVKSVPIQFFKDGLPAPEQKLWESPWGKIGICICYDLCYTRVTDELVRQGAQMIIAPTMDVVDWGQHQHELHARVAPVRAAEYGIPIFRVASSGISQGVNRFGRVQSSAPFRGEGEIIFFGAQIGAKGSLPLDRYLAPLCVGVTGLFVVWLAVTAIRRTPAVKPQPAQA
jgi:apolipoprotein N-acyltransferase